MRMRTTVIATLLLFAGLSSAGANSLRTLGRGPLLEPGALRVEADVPALALLFPDYPVRNVAPLDLGVREGSLLLRQVRLAGEGTDLLVGGEIPVLEDGPIRLRAEGRADLRALSGITRRLRDRGDARLELDVAGTRDAPRVSGVESCVRP